MELQANGIGERGRERLNPCGGLEQRHKESLGFEEPELSNREEIRAQWGRLVY